MRIVIDMQGAQTPFSRHRGVGRYTLELTKALALNSAGHELILALNGFFADAVDYLRAEFEGILPQTNIRVWQQFYDCPGIDARMASKESAAELSREVFLNSLAPDVIFLPNLQEGFFDAAVTSIKRIPTSATICSTLHDTIPLIYPERYLSERLTRLWYEKKIDGVRNSDFVLTVSDSSRQDIIRYVGIDPAKVLVVPNAVDPKRFRVRDIAPTVRDHTCRRFGIRQQFILYAGGNDAHKNLNRLYQAFAALPSPARDSHQLVVVGREPRDGEATCYSQLRSLGIADRVIFTGKVDDDELVILYNLCCLFVFPSIHEGFGLPVLEAMACGAPVLASNAASLSEIVNFPEALFAPLDTGEISAKLVSGLSDASFRARLRKHGLRQAARFSWQTSAKLFLRALHDMKASPNYGGRDSHTLTGCNRNESEPRDPDCEVGDFLSQCIAGISDDPKAKELTEQDLAAIASSLSETFPPAYGETTRVFLDVSAIRETGDHTGIQRVVRAIGSELLKADSGISFRLVYTSTSDPEFYVAVDLERTWYRSQMGEEAYSHVQFFQHDVLVFLDLHPAVAISHVTKTRFLRNKGVRVYHLVYDLLPVTNPEWFWPELCEEFNQWLTAVTCADGALCISRSVAQELREWLKSNPTCSERPFRVGWFHLGADLTASVPTRGLPENAKELLAQFSDRVSFLMVGTIEPRKSHLQALMAFDLLWKRGIDVNLVMVGKRGWNSEEIAKKIASHPEFQKRLFWLQGISDEFLGQVYRVAACVIAASKGEGFGLPLIEGANYGIPIVARDIPVFREVAGDSAYYFCGSDPNDLEKAVESWLILWDRNIHPKSETMGRLSWEESAAEFVKNILEDRWLYTHAPERN